MATHKQHENRKKFTKEYKVKEIQRNLTKKARLKRGYLKVLKEEGYTVPDKKPALISKDDIQMLKAERSLQGKKKLDEKREIKKQRNRLQRDLIEERRKNEVEKLKQTKEKLQERERRKTRLTQRTKSGQPRMGPKIEDLLNKIKEDDTYTK